MERPELDAARLGRASWPVEIVPETSSTNAELLARTDAPDGTVLVAEHQTRGRGRLDRSWASPPRAGLTFSVLLRPGVPIATWGWLPLLAGVAVHDALTPLTPLVALKWPNDVLLGERKVAGILAQSGGDTVVLGVGLNVTTTLDELPVPTATSLLNEGFDADRTDLLVALIESLRGRYEAWRAAAGDAVACGLADAYRAACATLGREVAVSQTDGTVLRGLATGIDGSGRLEVAGRVIGAGDVEHLRSA